MEMVGESCHKNLVVILALVAQILQLHRLFSPLPALPLVSCLSLLDMVDHEFATSYSYGIYLLKVSSNRQSSSQLG